MTELPLAYMLGRTERHKILARTSENITKLLTNFTQHVLNEFPYSFSVLNFPSAQSTHFNLSLEIWVDG